jgi:hypothetical protein
MKDLRVKKLVSWAEWVSKPNNHCLKGRFQLSRNSKVLFVLVFTLIHMLVTVGLFLASFYVVMANADDGKPLPAEAEILVRVSDVFQWPVLAPLGQIEFLREVLPVYSVYIILPINSLDWALTALGIVLGLRRMRGRRRSHIT